MPDIQLDELTVFQERRKRLLDLIDEGVILIPSAKLVTKSFDTEFPFRQDSNFRYLTGFLEPDCLLVLKKTSEGDCDSYLFLREKNEAMETWTGKRLGVTEAPKRLDVNHAYPITDVAQELPEIFSGHQHLYYDLTHSELADQVMTAFKTLHQARKKKVTKPTSFHHLSPLLGELRLVKDHQELLSMKKGMELTSAAHQSAMAMSKAGINERQINKVLNYIFHDDVGEGHSYDNIVATGTNALTLHYINNDQDLGENDLVLIDAGAQFNGYATDVTRTYPASGRFSDAQKVVYQIVLDAQKASLNVAKPGATLTQMHQEACKVLVQGLIDLKILKGSLEEELKEMTYRKYYPHGTGHWLGLDVHDPCPYLDEDNNDKTFVPGMVMTCEPGLYLPEDDENVPERFRGIGVRIEDDIVITEHGHDNLSVMIPKEVKEVEDACAKELTSLPLSFL